MSRYYDYLTRIAGNRRPDYTSFAILLKAGEGAHDEMGVWPDLSGHGRNGVVSYFTYVPASGRVPAAYVANASSSSESTVQLPVISQVASEYTIYVTVRVDEVSNVYLLLMGDNSGNGGDFTYFGLNSNDVNTFFQRRTGLVSGARVNVPAGQTVVLTYVLKAGAAKFYMNQTLVTDNMAYTPIPWLEGFFGNQQNNFALRGGLIALAANIGVDSDARRRQVVDMLLRDANLA